MIATHAFLLLAVLSGVLGFHLGSNRFNRVTQVSMLFGTKKAAATRITISVDGKVIDCGDKPVNLRKELMANKVDVYPLKAKLTGMHLFCCLILF